MNNMNNKTQLITYAGGTDKGLVREQNEDSILSCSFDHSEVSLFIVADGVGGHEGGAVASKIAVETIKNVISKAVMLANSGGGYGEQWLENTLLHAIEESNNELLKRQVEQAQYSTMATTVVAVLVNKQQAVLSHLGDSRCYLYKNSELFQLTEDHTVLQKLLNEGKINQQQFNDLPMHNMISQALGLSDQIELNIQQLNLQESVKYLLCSDGLTNCLTDEQIVEVLSSYTDLDECVDELITRANDNGGLDNISVVIFKNEISADSKE